MTKSELIKDMRRHTGGCGMITIKQLADYLGYSHPQDCRKQFCRGLEAINGTRYYIPDVVERILEARVIK